MDVRIIDDEAGFASMSSEWNTLLEAARRGGPFLRHEWLLAWWRAFGREDDRLMLFTCRDASTGELIGVLPCYETSAGVVAHARVVRLLGDGHVGSTGLGAFMHPSREQEAAERLVEELAAQRTRHDVFDLRLIDTGSPFFDLACEMGGRSARVSLDCHVSARIDLPATWALYLAEKAGKRPRRAAGHGRRQLEKAGATVEMVREACELAAAIEDMLRLWEVRMKDVVGPRFCASPECRAFFSEVLGSLLSQGRLRLRFMVIDGDRIAVDLAFRYRDTTSAVLTGFDPQWSRLSVSNVLCTYVVEGAIDEGCAALDLGLGAQPYKLEWGASDLAHFSDVRVYARTTAARMRRTADASVSAGARAIEALPASFRPPLRSAGKSIRTLAKGLRG